MTKTLATALVAVALAALVGCQQPAFTDADADKFVEALMTNPKYQAYLADEDNTMVNAMLEHPAYQTTPAEDCATVILMAAVMSGEYELPPDDDKERLCAWYLEEVT